MAKWLIATQPTRPVLLRSARNGAYHLRADCWGERYEPGADPDGVEIPGSLWLPSNFARVPREQWARVVALYLRLLEKGNRVVDATSEVSVVFARCAADQFSTWRTFVPRQEVGGAHVKADLTQLCDLVTGEESEGFPDGWCHAGSSHSHHEMAAFFSGQDDRDELDVPGLHVVVGAMEDGAAPVYTPLASVVLRKARHLVPFNAVLDTAPTALEPHERCLTYVTKPKQPTLSWRDAAWADLFAELALDRTDAKGRRDAKRAARKAGLERYRTGPRFQAAIDAECREAALAGDATAGRIRAAALAAREAAKQLPTDQARTVHRLADAVQACRATPVAARILWDLVSEALDGAREETL